MLSLEISEPIVDPVKYCVAHNLSPFFIWPYSNRIFALISAHFLAAILFASWSAAHNIFDTSSMLNFFDLNRLKTSSFVLSKQPSISPLLPLSGLINFRRYFRALSYKVGFFQSALRQQPQQPREPRKLRQFLCCWFFPAHFVHLPAIHAIALM